MDKFKNWVKGLSVISKAAIIAALLIVFFGVIGAIAQPGKNANPVPITTSTQTGTMPKIETKTVTTTEAIPFTKSTVNDSNLEIGKSQIQIAGVNGVLTHSYQVTYTDGVETSRSTATDTITTPAINEITAIGTKAPAPICPNGTYVNSAGNTVCSPYDSPSAPAGASAQCGDGTYSFSQSRRGTCSSHGGVATWL